MKRKDRETRDRLLVENYIAQKQIGRTDIVRGLCASFNLSASYIYKIIRKSRLENSQNWEELHLDSAPSFSGDRLIVSNAIGGIDYTPKSWWKKLLNKLV